MIDFYLHWFNLLPDVNLYFKCMLLSKGVDLKRLYEARTVTDLFKELTDFDLSTFTAAQLNLFAGRMINVQYKEKAETSFLPVMKGKINAVSLMDRDYPRKLTTIYDPPLILYYLGKLPDEKKMSTAVVGARNASEKGLGLAYSFGNILSRENNNVISGLAVGVDAMTHKACVEQDKDTYAILGSGVDVPYPYTNIDLYECIIEKGGVISEFPPGEKPLACNFPRRNRIISGLADRVVLIEAGEHSGSLITASFALEQGRDIYAVPGSPWDVHSKGCNELIKKGGAGLITCPEDIILT